MKTLILVTFILILFTNSLFTQDLPYLEKLDGDFSQKIRALTAITDQNLREYLPYIEERYDIQETILERYSFVKALIKLEHPNAIEIVYYFIDNIDSFDSIWEENRQEYKARAVILLFGVSDYSQSQTLLDYLNSQDIVSRTVELSAIKQVYENVPAYRQQVIDILLSCFNNCDGYEKQLSLMILDEIEYINITSLCVSSGINSSDEWIRNYSYSILRNRNYSGFYDLIRQSIFTESSDRIRFRHAGNLINKFGEPFDIKFILDYLPFEPNPDRAKGIRYLIDDFKPRYPDLPTPEMMDSLDSYTDQIFQFGWISDSNTFLEFKEKTDRLRENYEAPNIKEVCWRLNAIIDLATQYHGNSVFTEEAYKFLYYYTSYIKENVETEFGTCE